MMTISVDWKSDGFDAGSKIEALDWKDWKRPVISLLRAKLFRKRTYQRRTLSMLTSIAGHDDYLQDSI